MNAMMCYPAWQNLLHFTFMVVVGLVAGSIAGWIMKGWSSRRSSMHLHAWGPWTDVPVIRPAVGKLFPEVRSVGQERVCQDQACQYRELA